MQKSFERNQRVLMNKSESKYFNTALKMDQAFLEILGKKEFAYITVKEICEKAGVNRSTFYLHYETMEDLLSECIDYINKQFLLYMKQETTVFIDRIQECSQQELCLITPTYLIPYLQYIKEHRRLFFTAMKNTKVLRLDETYQRMVRFVFTPILDRYQVPVEERRYIMRFYVQGIMAIIIEWLKDDCKDSVEYLADVIQKCVMQQNRNRE